MSPIHHIRVPLTLGIISVVLIAIGLFSFTERAGAQSQNQLVPLVTDQTPLSLSNSFGATVQAVVNQTGDYAFIGNGASGLYYRAAGAGAPTPVLLMGEEVPGFPGSRNDILNPFIRINNSGVVAWRADFFQANGLGQGAVFTYDGSIHQIVSGADLAPGAGGAVFGRNMVLIGLNNTGDVAFTAPLVPAGSLAPAQTTIYAVPSGGSPARIAGLGDSMPGGGTLATLTAISFNNQGEVLFRGNLTTTSGPVGVYVGSVAGGVRKIAAVGDSAPGGGTFGVFVNAFLNNAGTTALQFGSVIYLNTAGGGNSRLVGQADAVPAPVGGTFGAISTQAIGDGGHIVFTSTVNSSPNNSGVFRVTSGNPVEVVGYRNQAAPGAVGETFSTSFTGISVNTTGVVSFRSTLTGGPIANGLFQQSGANAPVNIALDGQAPPLSGGGTYALATAQQFTTTLDNGAVYFKSDIVGGSADYAEMLTAGSTTVLMSTADSLPAGSRVSLRTFRVGGAGDSVGFLAQRIGGRISIAVHSIANQATTVLVTDGDVSPATGGGSIRINGRNTVFQNTGGTVVFQGQIIGGTSPTSGAMFVKSPGGSLTKIAANGDIDPLTGKTFSQMGINALTPAPINDTGQVAFPTTLVPASGALTRVIYRWSPGTGLSKIAAVGDITSSGATITSFPNPGSLAINSSGQVAFIVTTSAAPTGTILVGSGGIPTKIVAVGDPGPSSSTFASLAPPSFNDSAEVAFAATLAGGPGGGVFVGSTSSPPVALALNGAAAPAGGNYSITTARADVVINNQHDVLFRSSLTGGTSDSGLFVRRGSGGPVQAVVLQGQAAPGTTGVFDTIQTSLNNLTGEVAQLGSDGDIAFQNSVLDGSQRIGGTWHVRPDNTLEEILVRGTVPPEFGGGTVTVSTSSTAWNSGGRFAMWARVSGGSITDVIFLFVPTIATNTPPGNDVPIDVTDGTTGGTPVSLVFSNVTAAGETTLITSSGGPTVPTAFALGDPPVFYNISTTATFNGAINVCIDFSNVSFPAGANLRLLHFDGTAWIDVTTSGPTNNVICGNVTSLSPFTVAQLTNQPPTADAGANQTLECNTHSGCTFTLNGTGSTDPDHDALSYVWKDGIGTVVGNTATVSLTRPLGTYTFSLTVSDQIQSSTATTQVTVQDTTAPTLSLSMSPNQIWPANKKLVNVTASISVSDACDPAPLVKLISITSNEPLTAGDIQGAAFNTDDRAFQLRASRAGGGSGRIYTITYRATDHSGNPVTATAQVLVPHDQGH
jgi:hypothetical protein